MAARLTVRGFEVLSVIGTLEQDEGFFPPTKTHLSRVLHPHTTRLIFGHGPSLLRTRGWRWRTGLRRVAIPVPASLSSRSFCPTARFSRSQPRYSGSRRPPDACLETSTSKRGPSRSSAAVTCACVSVDEARAASECKRLEHDRVHFT